jgi:hypothetical protein
MESYGPAERWVAKALDRFPRIRSLAKRVYQRTNYLIHRQSGQIYDLHSDARIATLTEWARVPDNEGDFFFGYYDKSPWSPDMQCVLFHRPVGSRAKVVVVDRQSREERTLGTTPAWNVQQGCQAQWLPGAQHRSVIFNDLQQDHLGCRLASLDHATDRFIPWPIQTVHSNGQEALCINYKRLHAIRPEYGYAVQARNFSAEQPLEQDGIWRVDLESGTADLVVRLADLARLHPRPEMANAVHKVNHVIYSPSGKRFVFMHRWIGARGKFSRLYVARPDGTDLHLLMDERMVSHYHWRDDDHLLVWGRTAESGDRYYFFDVATNAREIVGENVLDQFGDGHPSFSPDRRWIITDSYPDRARMRHLVLYDTAHGQLIRLGRFFAPWRFDGPGHCDLHPRWSPDGRWISIDSAHEGIRRSYTIDVRALLEG